MCQEKRSSHIWLTEDFFDIFKARKALPEPILSYFIQKI